MEAVRRTTSSEGAGIVLDGLGQIILPGGGDNAWPEAIIDAPSFPTFFASPPIFLSDATTAKATTNSCLGQPGVAMASEGAMADVGAPDQLVSGANASAAIASSSFSFFAPPSTFLLDATTNGGAPAASANTSSIQPSISTMSWEGIEIDLDGLGQALLPGDNTWLGAPIDAPSSPSFFASPSIFPSYATNNTCLSQPSITMESEGAMVDFDLDHLLSGDNPGLQVATIASSSTSCFACPSTFPSDATTNSETPASANACWIQPSISTTSSQGEAIDLDLMEHLLSGDNAWSEVAAIASSSTSFFDSPSSLPSDATANGCTPASTNTCLIQPSVPVPRNRPSEGAAVDPDHLLEQPLSLSGDNPWPELTTGASSPPSLFDPLSVFPSDSQTIMVPKPSSAYPDLEYYMSKRLGPAINHIIESLFQTYRCKDVHVQVWAPAKLRDGDGQIAYSLSNGGNERIGIRNRWRNVMSESTPVGLPGGVFMTKFYISGEPVSEAQSGHQTLGLRLFQKGLGVINWIMPTSPELDFTSEVDTFSRALQAFKLTDTNVPIIPRLKFNSASYKDALPEVLQVLRAACVIHELPLAQTWATCGQQRKQCRRHSDENCRYCISTIDVACHVNDPRVQIFHEACSEHQLLPGQGVAGKAFTTNQRCFLPDIGSSSEQEYPLSHHARIFKLKGAMAIRLKCTRTGKADFVLEFFLPTDCEVENEQKTVMDSLWVTVQSLSKTLRVVTYKEMEEDPVWEMNELNSISLQKNKKAKRRKPMEPRSAVWKSFTKVVVGGTMKAKCNYCDNNFCCDSRNGTTSLKTHLKRCKFNPDNRITGPL